MPTITLIVNIPLQITPSKSLLEMLPSDTLCDIMHSFSNYKDLYKLLRSSPVCYRIFIVYRQTILTGVASNIIGEGSWDAATAVLVYQRNGVSPGHSVTATSTPDYIALKKDLGVKFVLQRSDIPNLVKNQRFLEDFADESLTHPYAAQSQHQLSNKGSYLVTETSPSDIATRLYPFKAITGFSMKTLWEMWLLSLRWGFEDVITFANRRPLDYRELLKLHQLSCALVRHNDFDNFMCHPRWGDEDFWTAKSNLFIKWSKERPASFESNETGKNILLLKKMLFHLSGSRDHAQDFMPRHISFVLDYEKLSVEALVEKYRLNCGW